MFVNLLPADVKQDSLRILLVLKITTLSIDKSDEVYSHRKPFDDENPTIFSRLFRTYGRFTVRLHPKQRKEFAKVQRFKVENK